MKSYIYPILAICAAGSASATTLTFDVAGGVTNGAVLSQDYGDRVTGTIADASGVGTGAAGSYGIGTEGATPNVTVSYQGSDPSVWSTGYGILTNVFYEESDNSTPFGFTLTADAGFEVSLLSFSVANFGSSISIPGLSILVDSVLAYTLSPFPLPSRSSSGSLSPGLPELTGSEIVFSFDRTGLGNNADNIGLDNITFSQSTVAAPIPLPAGLPLLLAGIGGLALLRRRQG